MKTGSIMHWNQKLLVAAGIMLVLSACNTGNEEALKGKLKRESIEITTKVPGRIVKMNVQEGDVVQKGDTLAVLHIPEVEAKMLQAEGALLSARSQYQMAIRGATDEQKEQVDAVFQAAKEQFQFIKKTMERMHEMYEDSLISTQQYDEVTAKFQGAKAQLEQARAKRAEVETGTRAEQVKMAQGQMQRAEGALQEARVAYNERFIVAPTQMDIQTVSLDEGELAMAGYTLFSGYKPGEAYLRFTVPESQVAQFKVKGSYTITHPYTERSFSATLTSVRQLLAYANKTSSYPNYSLGESIYELKLVPDTQEEAAPIYTNSTVLLTN